MKILIITINIFLKLYTYDSNYILESAFLLLKWLKQNFTYLYNIYLS